MENMTNNTMDIVQEKRSQTDTHVYNHLKLC